MSAFKEHYTIKLHDTDAAGILFFANQFKIAHDIYESFLIRLGFGFGDRFRNRDFFIPIVHAESDFLKPLRVGDKVEIILKVSDIGKTSFTLDYKMSDPDGNPVGTAKTVHVTIAPDSGKKIDLPEGLRKKLGEWIET